MKMAIAIGCIARVFAYNDGISYKHETKTRMEQKFCTNAEIKT